MLHIVKLIERRFPGRRTAIVATLVTLSGAALVLGLLLQLR